jgi:hypothetical protein
MVAWVKSQNNYGIERVSGCVKSVMESDQRYNSHQILVVRFQTPDQKS